jgi:hypothetical protein
MGASGGTVHAEPIDAETVRAETPPKSVMPALEGNWYNEHHQQITTTHEDRS